MANCAYIYHPLCLIKKKYFSSPVSGVPGRKDISNEEFNELLGKTDQVLDIRSDYSHPTENFRSGLPYFA